VAEDESHAASFVLVGRSAITLVRIQDAMAPRGRIPRGAVQPDAPQVDLSNIQRPGFTKKPGL
jgi:hypothetical protein